MQPSRFLINLLMTAIGTLRVDLSAIQHNWLKLNDVVGASRCGAVVKADAYGLGVRPVVKALLGVGCRDFFVANIDEGLEVGPLLHERCNCYVLQGCPVGTEPLFERSGLKPVIISLPMLKRWAAFSQGRLPSVLKVNTGMNRLGLQVSEADTLLDSSLVADAGVEMLMSHLACADEPEHALNKSQLSSFESLLVGLRKKLPGIKASLANSGGVFLGDAWHFDVIRPGITLFGGRASPLQVPEDFKHVVSLYLRVVQIRQLDVGDRVGYGGEYVASERMTVAVASGGYADGIARSWSPGGRGWFGRYLPIVGRVSMDSCVFDLSPLSKEGLPNEGDLIEVLGPHCPVDDMAKISSTIPYEILTRLGARLEKHYIEVGDDGS